MLAEQDILFAWQSLLGNLINLTKGVTLEVTPFIYTYLISNGEELV